MDKNQPQDLFHGLFEYHSATNGAARLRRAERSPTAVPDPDTGRPLKVAHLEVTDRAVCPACTQLGAGGYVSFISDMRMAFACPACRKLIWTKGA